MGKRKRGFVRARRCGDIAKVRLRQIAQRTAARASAKIGRGLGYYAAAAIRRRWWAGSCAANSVTIENRASRQGLVRATAMSDNCRCVSTPRWARFLKGNLDGPAPHEPPNDLRELARRIRAEQGLGREARFRIADEHPSDRHDGQAPVPQNRGVRGHLDRALARPVLAGHHDYLPARVLGHQPRRERRPSRAFGARASNRAGRPSRRGIVDGCVETQAGDRRDAGATHRIKEQEGREAAIAHQDEVAPRQPEAGLESELASDVEQRLVATAPFATGALRRHQRGQERQGPDASRPGDRGEHHQAHPAQPARLDEMAVGGANGIAVDALGRDPLAEAALDRVVHSQETTGPRCANASMRSPSRMRLSLRGHHAAGLRMRWTFTNCRPRARHRMRRTLATVRRPGVRIAPISRG